MVAARGRVNTGPAREAYAARWERLVDPEGTLPPEVRAKRAAALRKAHYARLALASAIARGSAKRPRSIHPDLEGVEP